MINYTIKNSRRTRTMRLAVYADGRVCVTKPNFLSANLAKRFVEQKIEWIKKRLDILKNSPLPRLAVKNREDYLMRREDARKLVSERLAHFNQFYNFTYQRVSIRDTRTRWGSCSRRGNLNFSYRLLDLTPENINYIIVHELCHLREFNHSPRFWLLVSQTIPDYRLRRRELRSLA